MVLLCNGIVLTNKKERTTDTHNNLGDYISFLQGSKNGMNESQQQKFDFHFVIFKLAICL